MSKNEKNIFYEVLENVKFPNGYASNVSRCVCKKCSLSSLKSHDCHALMQLLLPIALRGTLPDKVSSVLIELCAYFRGICGKTLQVNELKTMESKIALTLCNKEKIFPPSFFIVMVHLVVHLATEARIAGPVHNRWMYLIERYKYFYNFFPINYFYISIFNGIKS